MRPPRLCEALGLAEGSGEGRIVAEIMHGHWREAYEVTTVEGGTAAARDLTLASLRKVLRERVLAAAGADRPLLPSLEALLREAAYANPDRRSNVSENLLKLFSGPCSSCCRRISVREGRRTASQASFE